MQRALVREALGKLRAAEELFGVEDAAVLDHGAGFEEFSGKLDEFEAWLFGASPIA